VPLEQDLEQGGADGLLLAGGRGGAGPSAAAVLQQQLGERLPGAWRRIAVGSRPLLLLAHRDQLAGRGSTGVELPRFLLPACGSALLAEQLEGMGWLALEQEPQCSAEVLIGRLGQGRLLLPAAGSLLDHSPWREAGLVALLRQRLGGGCQQKTPAMGGGSPERPRLAERRSMGRRGR
jgi:hypothetical protein